MCPEHTLVTIGCFLEKNFLVAEICASRLVHIAGSECLHVLCVRVCRCGATDALDVALGASCGCAARSA